MRADIEEQVSYELKSPVSLMAGDFNLKCCMLLLVLDFPMPNEMCKFAQYKM